MDENLNKLDTVQSVERALQVLEIVSRLGSVSLNDLRRELDVNKASLLRLAHTLVVNGYMAKSPQTGNYSLTLKTYEVGISAVQSLNQISIINTVLVDLRKETERIAQFSIEDNNELICLQSIGQTNPVFSVYTSVGKRSPLYCTSAGKAILSTYSNDEIIGKWDKLDPKPLTQNTHVDVQSLLKDIGEIRRRNYAVDREENEYNVFCVGAVVMNHTRTPIGAISVSAGSLTEAEEERVSPLVVNAARRLSNLLGYASADVPA
ncbi:IclR family transcriptional regulator [Deltaproteobacteria bacterium Smac51]|nr:IclR family transcriptional regulator [Deltaproteobacteria bacterium Smac51]